MACSGHLEVLHNLNLESVKSNGVMEHVCGAWSFGSCVTLPLTTALPPLTVSQLPTSQHMPSDH